MALLSKNPFARPATKARDALAVARAASAKKLAAAEEAAKKKLAAARASSYALATKAKEPLVGVAYNEGIRIAGHTGAFIADMMIPMRGSTAPGVVGTALNIVARPATVIAGISFTAAAFTKGSTRLHAREVGQGALHHAWAVFLRKMANAIGAGSADRAMGDYETEGAGELSGDGEADY